MRKLYTQLSLNHIFILQIFLILLWGSQLLHTNAYYVVYLLLTIISIMSCYNNIKSENLFLCKNHEKNNDITIYFFSFLFSCMITFANYKIWSFPNFSENSGYRFMWIYKIIMMILLFLGGFVAFGNIFHIMISNIKRFFWKKNKNTYSPITIYIISFISLVLTRWIVLYYCQYPGVLSNDSMIQMRQLLTNSYTNHHPFYHTMVIKSCIILGMKLFHDINAAVAVYSFFQILFTAMSFSFVVSSMAMMKTPNRIIITSMLFYILMPYHIMYAISMWKDIMFGCFILLFITFLYRYMIHLGNSIFNYVMLTISILGVCLFRSNGFFTFVLLGFAFTFLWKFKYPRIITLFVSMIFISFFMKHTLLEKIGVAQPDPIESLSIPAQQIARVVQEGLEITDNEEKTLEKIVDVRRIPDTYAPFISDPIKNLVREKGNQPYILTHKKDYIKLYISLGIRYPMSYLCAWIDQTSGYWNAGYEYWRWSLRVIDNDMGIRRTTKNVSLNVILEEYLWLYENIQGLRIFLSIGLFVWIDILSFMISYLRKDKIGLFLSSSIIVLVASLLVATPVHSEFRYMYAAFCSLPLIIVIALRPIDDSFVFWEKT